MRIQKIGQSRGLFLAGMVSALASCSSSSSLPITCAGGAMCNSTPPAGGTASGSLAAFTPPADPGPGGVLFTASGEELALTGYAFPAATAMDPVFYDGWDVKFTRLLVTIDNITLSEGPNARPGNQSCTEPTVAKVSGPWAVDLSHDDPGYLMGKGGGGEKAVPIVALKNQNYPAGNSKPFDTGGATPYAFGFEVAQASSSAMNVNLDAAALTDYQSMITDGCAVLYVGTATFQGATCKCPKSATDTDQTCDKTTYDSWPAMGESVPFHLCFKSPTTYVNCQNPDNMNATPLPNEEYQRGIFFKSAMSVVAQVTIHTDHPFWDSVLHDSPAHFDQFAALVAGKKTNGAFPTVTLEPAQTMDYTGYKDAAGNTLNWRYCQEPPTDVHPKFTGPMAFDPHGLPHTSSTDGCMGLRNYSDYSTYNQSTQGHLNSDGLCYVARHYPSPN
jgi:hypothetical protein